MDFLHQWIQYFKFNCNEMCKCLGDNNTFVRDGLLCVEKETGNYLLRRRKLGDGSRKVGFCDKRILRVLSSDQVNLAPPSSTCMAISQYKTKFITYRFDAHMTGKIRFALPFWGHLDVLSVLALPS